MLLFLFLEPEENSSLGWQLAVHLLIHSSLDSDLAAPSGHHTIRVGANYLCFTDEERESQIKCLVQGALVHKQQGWDQVPGLPDSKAQVGFSLAGCLALSTSGN